MPLETLELPRDMVAAARSYAAREHTSIVDLFANALKTTYGIDCLYVLNGNAKPVRRPRNPQGIVANVKVLPVANASFQWRRWSVRWRSRHDGA